MDTFQKRTKWDKKTERDPLDFYPTPAPVTAVLRDWLVHNNGGVLPYTWLDPAAGDGALIRVLCPLVACRIGIELHLGRAAFLSSVVGRAIHGDALKIEWPHAHVAENPPFSLLDDFWQKTTIHRARWGVWCAALTPVAWWHAEKRASYVRPDYKLALGWRPSFRTAPGAKPKSMQDYEWSVLAPVPQPFTRWERLEKPAGA